MKFLSVCSGIEAASCAWDWEAVAFSEIEKFPSQVLSHHYPETPNWGDMTKFKEWPDANVDVLVGGTPCQSFSVAGLRKGLDDPRGNLMLTYLAIAAKYRPKWVVWENVPGVLSSNGGLDFASFLRGLGECGYGFAYRVLDAQYFGVPQRRRRVFVVGCLGDWRSAAAVLFEQHSLQGHPAPSRKKGESVAGTFKARANSGGWNSDVDLAAGNYMQPVAKCLTTSSQRYDTETETLVTQPIAYNITFCDANGTRADRPNGGLYVSETDVTSTLTKAGIGTNVAQPIAFSGQMSNPQTDVDMTGTLEAKNPMAVAQPIGTDLYNGNITGDIACTMGTPGSSVNASGPTVMQSMAVRRLTPVECERLQGFPDGYTDIQLKGKPAPDGPRYKALGNSMAVPVMRWIGQRIEAVDRIK
jgi:DNA (cytosine-5)-methyltransferase 1